MKKLVLLFASTLLISSSISAQKIVKNEIDKFTKKQVIQTSFEKISGSGKLSNKHIMAAFIKNGDAECIRLKWLSKDMFRMDKDRTVIFLDANGNPHEFTNIEYVVAEKGGGVVGYVGSDALGLDIWLAGDCSIFEDNDFTDIRINTNDGYADFKMTPKDNESLKNTYKVYKKAL